MSLILTSPRYGKTDFGSTACAPWVRGFFEDMHWPMYGLYSLGLTWKKTTFAAKTITLDFHHGNVQVTPEGKLAHLYEKAVYVNFWKNYFINAFGLSNPGLEQCLALHHWQDRTKPFILSFTSVKKTTQDRLYDVMGIVDMLEPALKTFKAPVALQWNIGCPNAGVYKNITADALAQEIIEIFEILRELEIPLILNCNALMPLEVITKIHAHVDAFWIGNIIPFGNPAMDWKTICPDGISPIVHRGLTETPGGYSGPLALPLTIAKVREIRAHNITTPIIAGNGIRKKGDVLALKAVGADAIFIGSIILRPWRMRGVIQTAHDILS